MADFVHQKVRSPWCNNWYKFMHINGRWTYWSFFTLITIGLSQSYCKTGSLWSWRRGALKNITTQFSSGIALRSACEYVITTFWLTTHVSLDCVDFPGRRVCSSTRPLQVPVFLSEFKEFHIDKLNNIGHLLAFVFPKKERWLISQYIFWTSHSLNML